MSNPYQGLNVSFRRKPYSLDINEFNQNEIINYGNLKEVTNYDYEIQQNEKKRQILILKPEYLSGFIQDLRNIMRYDKSSQTLNNKTKRAHNSKTSGA